MSETVLVAIVAVVGTSFGAAISPLITLIRDAMQSQSGERSERLRAAAQLGEALVKLARIAPAEFNSVNVRQAQSVAIEARFDLAKYLPKGAGQVDAFIDHGIGMISTQERARDRLVIAEHCASEVLAWARGDRAPAKLTYFDVAANGSGPVVII